ncbi:hypothetical protein [Neisseria sp. Ec49-e6-T10]|uniref:hypothetical protein n=1 Tax=Neisseria sp. Ec49-e6-T10 TaxID=3140744 RepID=UPI003EBF985B
MKTIEETKELAQTKKTEQKESNEPPKITIVTKQLIEKMILGIPAVFLFILSLRKKDTLKKLAKHKNINLDELESLTVSEILAILNFSQNLVEVSIDVESLSKGLEYMKKMNEQKKYEGKNIVWLIENGATKAMILEVFPSLTEQELAHWYFFVQQDGIEPIKVGRIAAIPEPDFERATHDWHSIQLQELPYIEKLRSFKQAYPQYTLARLNTVIKAKDI